MPQLILCSTYNLKPVNRQELQTFIAEFVYIWSIPCFAKCDYFATTYVIVVSRHFCSEKPHVRKSSRTRDIFAECVSIWSLPWLFFFFAKCDYFATNCVIRVSRQHCSEKPHVLKTSRTTYIFAECVSIWSLPWFFWFFLLNAITLPLTT